MASFAGTDQQTLPNQPSENHPPYVVADFISDKTTTYAYKAWLGKFAECLQIVAGGIVQLLFFLTVTVLYIEVISSFFHLRQALYTDGGDRLQHTSSPRCVRGFQQNVSRTIPLDLPRRFRK